MKDYSMQSQMGSDLPSIDLTNINWGDILKSAGGELVAQQLQTPEVQEMLKQAGANVAVQTASQQTEALKEKLSSAMTTLSKYKFWIIGGLVVGAGAYIYFKRR